MTPLDLLRQHRAELLDRVARLEGELAGLDRAIAILDGTESAVPHAAETGSGMAAPAAAPSPGAASKDRIEAATPATDPGDGASGAAALPRPAEPPGTRPPAEAPAKPAGASSPPAGGTVKARLRALLERYAATGEKLPTDGQIAESLGTTDWTVRGAMKDLRREEGFVTQGGRAGRVVEKRGAAPAPAGEEREAAPVAATVEEVARFLRDSCAMRVVTLPGGMFWLDGIKVDEAGLVERANARRLARGLPPFALAGEAA